MKLEIKKQRDTPLLSRKRVTLMAEYDGATPSRPDIRKEVAKKVGAKDNLVVIKHIYTRFGSNKAKIIAHVYDNEKDMKSIEHESLLVKHDPEAGKKKGEKAAEEANPEEKPKEGEKKPEQKQEKKEEKTAGKKEDRPKEEPKK